MTLTERLHKLAELSNAHHQAKQIAEEAREAFEKEMAPVLTAEKQTYLELEAFKTRLREDVLQRFRDDGEKPTETGLTLAMLDAIQIDDEQKAVQFCAQYAPFLLQLRGKELLKEWAAKHLSLIRQTDGSWLTLYEARTPDGQAYVVPAPFRIVRQPSVRISEKEIVSAVDELEWEKEQNVRTD